MKFRVRFEKQRFGVEVDHGNCTVENLRQALCNELSIRDISLIQISLNGRDIIEENDRTLSSLGLVNNDLVYALSSNPDESVISDQNVIIDRKNKDGFCKMKFRISFEKQRFGVEVDHGNCIVENLRQAICNELSIRDISLIQISLNGRDIIEENDRTLSSLGLVNNDLVYALSSNPDESVISDQNVIMLSQLIDMGFDKELAGRALLQINSASIEAAIEILTNNEVTKAQTLHDMPVDDLCDQPSTSETSDAMNDTRHVADDVCNPVFCRDGVSATLEMLYNAADVKTHHHAVFVLIHALMLESGFYLKKDDETHKAPETLPVEWNNTNVVKLLYLHNLSSSISCQLVFSSLGPFAYAHVWSEETQSNAYKVKLVVSQYIKGDVPLAAGAKSVYKNLHKVSRIVKNDLVHPLLAHIQSHLGVTSPFSLSGLPPEIQLMMLSQLTSTSLVSLSATCKSLNTVCNDEQLWQFFCQRDFGVESKTEESWKKQYKVLYKRRQQLEGDKFEATSSFYPEFPVVIPGFNPFLPRVPQILGGPHDLFPDFLAGQPRDETSLRILHPEDRSRSDLRLRTGDRATPGTFFA